MDPLTRRTVVRSVGHAAWIAPAVVVAAAVPSYAASGAAAVSAALVQPVRLGTTLPVNANLTNTGGQASVNLRVQLRLDIPSAATTDSVTSSTPAGWGPPSYDRGTTMVTITYDALAEVQPGAVMAFNPIITLGFSTTASGSATVTPLVDAPGTSTPSATLSYT